MTSPRDESGVRVDSDGVRVVRSARPRLVGWLALGVAALAAWTLLGPGHRPAATSQRPAPVPAATSRPDPAPVAAADPTAADAPAAAERRAQRRREIHARRLARKLLPRTRGPDGKPEIQAADAIAALRAAGVTDGIAAFEPPGTNPPRAGVIVPDGVELPEGYLRHYQTTDDGQALPPILLFHPDYEFFDEAGERVEVPADRVVPPDLVPPGIPIEILEPPGRAPAH